MPGTLITYTVFFNPSDFPGQYVVRAFEVVQCAVHPSAMARSAQTLAEARTHIPRGLFRMDPQPGDHPSVIEVWF